MPDVAVRTSMALTGLAGFSDASSTRSKISQHAELMPQALCWRRITPSTKSSRQTPTQRAAWRLSSAAPASATGSRCACILVLARFQPQPAFESRCASRAHVRMHAGRHIDIARCAARHSDEDAGRLRPPVSWFITSHKSPPAHQPVCALHAGLCTGAPGCAAARWCKGNRSRPGGAQRPPAGRGDGAGGRLWRRPPRHPAVPGTRSSTTLQNRTWIDCSRVLARATLS